MTTVPTPVLALVDLFERNQEAYLSASYNEAQVRHQFIDPFFAALGWDVQNTQGYAEAYKDVVHEDAIKVGGAHKAPDYSFRVGGTRKFFVEAKKPAVNLRDDITPAYQLRRYAWSAKLPLSILTDFEELSVYDCRVRPSQTDKPAAARTLYVRYTDYPERWEEIAAIFSKEAVLQGSFDRYAESTKSKRGTATVDATFLKQIEAWRQELARTLHLRNPQLTQRQLNFAVQMTIDRIIFLRMAEDRGIEEYGRLQALLNGNAVYERLGRLYQQADERYNSGLFHFRKEPGRPDYDDLTPTVTIDDRVLKEIIKSLYYPESPFEFSALPVAVLGQVYEQFLGSVIQLSGRKVEIEEKPEVKKAGGVYYTPTYIVDTIVHETLDKLLEGKRPGPRGGVSRLRIVDPACGSGSFLIGAYQYLLDWHRDRYVEDGPESHTKELYQGSGGQWLLTTQEKKRILLNNIYGVDIDPQAVEVTKLSLLLKVLEGESQQTLVTQLRMFQERALPDLEQNIKCGNSLIDPSFYTTGQMSFLDEEAQYRINVFDWRTAFPTVFSGDDPGFDAVVGNPPYIRIQALKEWAPIEVEYYKQAYQTARQGNYDIYVVFVERGLELLNSRGRLGFILPHKFFNAQYGQALRSLLSEHHYVSKVVYFGDEQVFEQATTYTCLLFLDKTGSNQIDVEKADDLLAWRTTHDAQQGTMPAAHLTDKNWNLVVGETTELFARLQAMPVTLQDVTSRIFQGLKTSGDKVYIVQERERRAGQVLVYSPEKAADYWIEPDLLHPLIKGGDSKRYHLSRTDRLILFPYAPGQNGATGLIPEAQLQTDYPLTWRYLVDNKRFLENRERGKMRGAQWYGFGRTQALDVMPLPKLFTPDIAARAAFSIDPTGEVFFTGGVAGGYGILPLPTYSREYLLGVLNSKLLEWFIRQTSSTMRGGYYSYESRFIAHLPIVPIDDRSTGDRGRQDQIGALVQRLLELHTQLASAKIGHDREILARQIDAMDQQVNRVVYELYGLTEEEIRSIESAI